MERVITLAAGEHAGTPRLLPGGDALLFTLAPGAPRPDWQRASVVVQSLSSGQRDVVAPSEAIHGICQPAISLTP